MRPIRYLELVCPAGTPAALRAAIAAGADTVYCGLADATTARNYPGLNFSPEELGEGIAYAHAEGRRVLVAVNTFPRAGATALWRRALDTAAEAGADAVILADLGVLDDAARRHPKLRRHLSVQAAAANPLAIAFYRERFAISRVVLPRVLAVSEVAALIARIGVEAEVFAFGSLGTMVEGRCYLSSYITGRSPSSDGVCAPAEHVAYREDGGALLACLGGAVMNRFAAGETRSYPTPCKARLVTNGEASYLFEEPV
ncbi:MAG: U32 family peptidase, partial [Rhodospirillales bacterium]|nr:U32 family peptidase [Rhodospirillales bacterium]